MKVKNNPLIFILLGAIVVFIGFKVGENKTQLKTKAGEIAVGEAIKYGKSEWEVTKNWYNSFANKIKQIL